MNAKKTVTKCIVVRLIGTHVLNEMNSFVMNALNLRRDQVMHLFINPIGTA